MTLSAFRMTPRAVFVFAAFLFLAGGNTHAQGSVADDTAALVELYNATDGANWTNKTNWGTTQQLSSWFGVTTDSGGRVTRVSLSGNQLTGSIPSKLEKLTSLTQLYLNNNQLTGTIPSELEKLTSLTQLYLNNNQLTGSIPSALGKLTSLDRLWLYVNQLTGPIPSELGNLTNLTNLSLHRNQLTGTIPSALGNLTNLTRLSLYGNQLTGSIPSELEKLTSLTNLWLNGNQLTGSIPSELEKLTSLTQLYLNNNQLTGTIPSALGKLTSLDRLWLYVNQLTGTIPSELGDLTNLTNLSLHRNQLTGTIPSALGNLTNLTRLSLYGNQLTGSIPSELGNLTSLTNLWLNGNQLTGSIPPELEDLTSLTQLYLNNNQLTGTIPPKLGDLTSLDRLYLYGNQLTGSLPSELGDLTNLTRLYLHKNQLTGTIPSALGNLTNLTRLSLHNNQLTGPIPSELGQLASLVILWLNNNQLTGPIPSELGDWPSLTDLTLWRNPSIGPIPPALIPAVNRGALAWFYDNADGASWTDNTNWVSSQSISTWFGVTTNAAGEVTKLNLDNNGLSGPVAPGRIAGPSAHSLAWLGLVKLERLSISGNRGLKGQLQKDLRNSNLNFLDVSGTNLCAPSDSAFQAWLASITYKGATCRPSPAARAPRSLKADGKDEAVVLSWKAPASGGSAITDYEYRIGVRGDWISIGSTQTTYTVTGLVNGTTYVFQVRAVSRIGAGRASNRAEATTLTVLDFTHFANGTGITSEMVFVNVSSHPMHPALYFYDQGGDLVDPELVVDVMGNDLEIREDGSLRVWTEMEPLEERTIATHGQGDLVSGSFRVVSNGPIGGFVRYSVPGFGVAGVGASPAVRDALFPAHWQEGGIRTAAALHNLGEEAIVVSCRLMQEGAVLQETEIPLEANGQTSWFIDEAFPAADTSAFVGAAHCDVPGRSRFTAIAVEMDADQRIFTALPVVTADRTGGGGRETVLDFAHFANGSGVTSDFVFVNVSTQSSRPPLSPFHSAIPPSRPALYFYDPKGNLIAPESVVDVTGDLEVREDGGLTVRTEMEPLGVLTIATHGRGELVSGSVRVVSDGPLGGMLRYNLPHVGEAVAGSSPSLSDALFPVRRREGGINTGVALHNLESSPGLVRCELLREGVLLDAVPIPLEANGQTSWLIDQAFPGTDTSNFVGSVRCIAPGEGMFSAVALEMDPGNRIFTTLPVVPVPEMPSQE